MGWDAYAKKPGSDRWVSRYKTRRGLYVEDPALRRAFGRAMKTVLKDHETVDGMLVHGGLDFGEAGQALQLATGKSCWPENDDPRWSAEEVKLAAENAVWPETPDWFAASAKAFLETCAANGLEIEFSW